MALENLDPNELILMDKTYKERSNLRRELLKKYPDVVCRVNKDDEEDPRIRTAVKELYRYIMGIYLPNRYPQMFKLVQTDFETGPALMVRNLTTMELFPIQISTTRSTRSILETLIKSVDEDMLILLPERNGGDGQGKRGQKKDNHANNEKDSGDSPSDSSDDVIPSFVVSVRLSIVCRSLGQWCFHSIRIGTPSKKLKMKEMAVYKRVPAWGEAIKEFLRS
ncbi:conserved hypothetical protein [Histoplasma capsulatum H143]|uniref:Uncharacterized protein n=1 Tax=Ajellomyces capsulatus (strain H143) TaxID=544712 RepID=C6HRL0_AJECH|nr:conserved hypothetical protein [Histoplasma capsulatum H143]